MSKSDLKTQDKSILAEQAKSLARTPLGIIALFVLLVESIAALLLGLAPNVPVGLQYALGGFVILFPLVMLFVFRDLIVNHNHKLYSPSEFSEDKHFLRANRIDDERFVAVALEEAKKAVEKASEGGLDQANEVKQSLAAVDLAKQIAEFDLTEADVKLLKQSSHKSVEQVLDQNPDLTKRLVASILKRVGSSADIAIDTAVKWGIPAAGAAALARPETVQKLLELVAKLL